MPFQQFKEDYKDYLSSFKALYYEKGETAGCFYLACEAYCNEVLGFSLQLYKEDFVKIQSNKSTKIDTGLALLDKLLQTKGYFVSSLMVLTNLRDTPYQHPVRNLQEPFDYRKILGSTHKFNKEPCLIFINKDYLDKPFPENHYDTCTSSFELLDLAFWAFYIRPIHKEELL